MTVPSTPASRRDGEGTRQRLLRAALELYTSIGFRATTTPAIAAKAGVAGMSRALARELGSRHITVNCVAPGFIDTDMTRSLNESQTAALIQQIPLGRFGQPEDVAAAVAYLCSPQAAYVTGVALPVDGGWLAR